MSPDLQVSIGLLNGLWIVPMKILVFKPFIFLSCFYVTFFIAQIDHLLITTVNDLPAVDQERLEGKRTKAIYKIITN